ncbi:4-carboxy-4-hydroxy-2-oxoadipate aldolase/oxaloacetate decarboxylase, partial [Sphaerobacter thermophilus]|uniref:4-carboxy-4-hydroxy-2-oxoadipate aldolase/oxaloacetate decarboxylase n=1 Tax=Sphaerobacter thermophilus TaxID=2057 RepID=UPI0039C4BA83
MKPCVIPTIERPDPAVVQSLAGHGVATVHEAMGRQGLLDVAMRPIKEGWSICGPAVTSLNHVGDNLMIHAALDVCQPGDVLVITTTAPTTCGMVGELLARQAKVRGVAGIIIEGGVRDVADLRRLDLPIWSTAISAAGTVKATPGWVNVPVVCCGVHIRPGDVIVA